MPSKVDERSSSPKGAATKKNLVDTGVSTHNNSDAPLERFRSASDTTI